MGYKDYDNSLYFKNDTKVDLNNIDFEQVDRNIKNEFCHDLYELKKIDKRISFLKEEVKRYPRLFENENYYCDIFYRYVEIKKQYNLEQQQPFKDVDDYNNYRDTMYDIYDDLTKSLNQTLQNSNEHQSLTSNIFIKSYNYHLNHERVLIDEKLYSKYLKIYKDLGLETELNINFNNKRENFEGNKYYRK